MACGGGVERKEKRGKKENGGGDADKMFQGFGGRSCTLESRAPDRPLMLQATWTSSMSCRTEKTMNSGDGGLG